MCRTNPFLLMAEPTRVTTIPERTESPGKEALQLPRRPTGLYPRAGGWRVRAATALRAIPVKAARAAPIPSTMPAPRAKASAAVAEVLAVAGALVEKGAAVVAQALP